MSIVSTPALSRRERERLARRAAILAAALDVFAEYGYEQATLDQVAERAEFGKGTLYNYFPGGKEAILAALFDEMYEGLREAVAACTAASARAQLDTRSVFHRLIASLIDHFAENRASFLLLMREAQRLMLGKEPEIVASQMAKRDAVVAEMEPLITSAIEGGQLKPYPPKAIAHMLLGNVKGYLIYAFSGATCGVQPDSVWPPIDQAAEFITDVLFSGLLTHDS